MKKVVLEEVILEDKRENSVDDSNDTETKLLEIIMMRNESVGDTCIYWWCVCVMLIGSMLI